MATRKKIPLITEDATLNIAAGLTLDISGADVDIVGSGAAVITFPSTTSTLATLTGTETLTNKTLTSPVIGSITNTGTLTLPTTTGTVALTSDITGTNSGTNTGDNSANTNYASDYRIANFVADVDYQSVLAEGVFADGDKTKLDTVDSNADVTGSNAPQAHTASHAVGGADAVFPADPGADKILQWDDSESALAWVDAGAGGATQLSDLSDVGVTTATDKNALMADGDSWESRALAEADISDLGTYSTDIHSNITALNAVSNTNTGDQTTIVGITGTKAQFDTAVTDGNITYDGDAPTAHKASHEDGGADEISIAGLLGTPAALSTHESDTTTHGTTGDIVGTTDTQTLTNKDLSSATNILPDGSVLQVIMGATSTQTFNTTDTLADTTLTATITPTSSSSKILAMVTHGETKNDTATSGVLITLLRGATGIMTPTNYLGYPTANLRVTCAFNYLDSPATTSATTYKTQFKRGIASTGTATVQEASGTSTIILMEIAA